MNRRLLVVALAAAAAIALLVAVPALGRDAVAPTFDRKASAGALIKAKRALRQARQAQRLARGASDRAGMAQAQANAALALAEEDRSQLTATRGQLTATRGQLQATQSQLDALKKQVAEIKVPEGATVASSTAPGLVSSSAVFGEYEALGGPSVQVTVPASGLIEVWAQVGIEDEDGGAVGLYEDGQKITGISAAEFCGDSGGIQDGSALIDMQGTGPGGQFIAAATPPVPGFLGCASAGSPSPVLLSRPPGSHTYELRYSECSCNPGGGAEFRDRVLRVAPRP